MQHKITLSVVIPIYNAEEYIDRCLNSILKQRISGLEVICVDDGSADNSYSILKRWKSRYANVRVLQQKNSYAGTARNLGASVAKGDYIHFMDIDDCVIPGAYEKILNVIKNYRPEFMKAKAYAVDAHTKKMWKDNPYDLRNVPKELFGKVMSFRDKPEIFLQLPPVPWNGIVKKAYIDENYILFNHLKCVNDRSFFIHAVSHAESIYLLDEYIVMHQVNNPKSLAGGRRNKENFHCYIEACGLVAGIIKDLPYDLQRIVFGNELIEFANDFMCLHEDVQEEYKEPIKREIADAYLINSNIKALDNYNVKKMFCKINKVEWDMNELRIMSLEELERVCDSSDEIIIYGAGRVCYALLQYLAKHKRMLDKIFCIMVSDKKNNPDNVMGIPVCARTEVGVRDYATVFIATFENAHEAIAFDLCTFNYKQVQAIGNVLYAQLRKMNQDLSVDIIQNTQWIRDDLRRTKNEILQAIGVLNDRLGRVETCLQNGVHYPDELLLPNQYEDALKNWYQSVTGKTLDLNNPQTYNEKIQWIKLHGVTPLMTKLTDKYAVREWVKEKIGEEYLVSLLGVWESFDDIDIDALPDKFVLKCNHGCTWNEIVQNKIEWNAELAKKKFDRWMITNFAFRGGLQLQYKDIPPKILAEEYMENEVGDLYDYKFWCFDGRVEFVMFLSERSTELRMNNYDKEWNLLPFTYDHPNTDREIPRPEKLDEMIRIAEILAEGFPHVRVDLYQLNDGTIKFGEMTFTSCNGTCGWSDEEANLKLGKLLKLNEV